MSDEITLAYSENWSITKRIAFRFAFVFLILFIILQNNGAYPFWYLLDFMYSFLSDFIPWVGKNILNINRKIDVAPNGSGDTTYDNIIVFCILVISSAATVLWSIADRKRKSYNTLYYWLTVAVRYYVAFMLFTYGMVKIFKLQFPYPDMYRMSEPYGHSTPMGLAWTFFGYSKGYNWFVGIAELFALLLLFRRTLALGAVITLMTTLNIAAVNFFFDVPVKLMSVMLVGMMLFLLARDLRRIFTFFLTQRPVDLPAIQSPDIKRKWMRVLKNTFKFALLGYVVGWGGYELSQVEGRGEAPKPDWYGLYEINEVIHINDTITAPHATSFLWKEVVLGRSNQVFVRMMNDSSCGYTMHIFVPDTTMTFVPNDQRLKNHKSVFRYDMSDSANIRLTGNLNGDSVLFVLHKVAGDESDFKLDSTDFHWISDKPNNK